MVFSFLLLVSYVFLLCSPTVFLLFSKATGAPTVVSAAGAQAPLSAQAQTPTVSAAAVPVDESDSASSAAATSMLATRTLPPIAVIAVPLSLVGAILLVAIFLSIKNDRKLAEERAQDVEKLVLSRKSSVASSLKSGFSRQSDIEHALNVLSKAQSQGDVKTMPVPLFMPVEIPVHREPRWGTKEAYHPKQYTEYCRPSQERRRYQESPPSYHTSRSPTHTRSLISFAPHSRASSRASVHPSSHHQERRLHCSEHEYISEEYWDQRRSRSRYETYNEREHSPYCEDEDMDCATHSVLDDYLFVEPPKPRSLPPDLSDPPHCLMPALRLHVRNSSVVSPRSRSNEGDEEDMKEVNLYDVVADSLTRARRR